MFLPTILTLEAVRAGADTIGFYALTLGGYVYVSRDDVFVAKCEPTGYESSDGRALLACGWPVNPAGFCCEHGTEVPNA